MKFVNREFGVDASYTITPNQSENYTASNLSRPKVGFGLDAKVVNGALLAGVKGSVWGIKFTYFKNGKWLTDEEFITEPEKYKAGSTVGDFQYICHGDLAVSMVKYSKNTVVLSITALDKTRIKLQFYCLTKDDFQIKYSGNLIQGSANKRAVILGDTILKDNGVVIKGRYDVIYDETSAEKEHITAKIVSGDNGNYQEGDGCVSYEGVLDSANPKLLIYLTIGDKVLAKDIPEAEELVKGINYAELAYSINKVVGSGKLVDRASDIISNCVSHKIYNPMRLNYNYIENRLLRELNYAYDPTNMAIGGLISCIIGDTATEQLATYSCDIIIGALANWVAFCRTRDIKILENAFPKWTSTVIMNPKLTIVDALTKREIAYKMPLSPFKDTKPQPLYSVDYNAYRIILLEIMEKAARILKKPHTERIKTVLNELKIAFKSTLYNEKLGLFMDRYTTGEFVNIYGATSFLPLLAGVVDTNDMLDALLINLQDSTKLWTETPVPTIPINHYEYGKKYAKIMDMHKNAYEDFTGSTVPYLNYLIYMGLVRIGANEASGKLAEKSAHMWRKYYKQRNEVPSIFLPNYKYDNKAVSDSLSGNLMGIIGINELIDVEYFRDDLRPAIRFGTLVAGDHRLSNMKLFGKKMSVTVNKNATVLSIEEREVITGVGGRFVVRQLVENANGSEFLVYAKSSLTFTVNLPIFQASNKEGNTFRFNINEGKHRITIADNRLNIKLL